MSRTIKKSKGAGYEFWSRRCFGDHCLSSGSIAKNITKRKERQRNRKMVYDALYDPEDYEKRFSGE